MNEHTCKLTERVKICPQFGKNRLLQKLAQNNNIIQKGGLIRSEILDLYENNVSSFIDIKEENLALLLQSYNKPYTANTIGM